MLAMFTILYPDRGCDLGVLAAWRENENMTENAIAKEIVDASFRIHTTLGPGLLEIGRAHV